LKLANSCSDNDARGSRVRRSHACRSDVAVALQFTQQTLHPDQMPVENLSRNVKEIGNQWIRDRVEGCRPLFSRHHDSAASKPRELLRHNRLVDTERLLQILHAGWP